MTLRTRLVVLVGSLVAATVALVTWTVSERARAAFVSLDAQRTSALVSQFRAEVARASDDVVRRVERVAASDPVRQLTLDLGSAHVDRAAAVNQAAALA